MFRVLSWGCGVQSTALAVLSALGRLERVDVVVSADLGWERSRTYEAREWYRAWLGARGVPVEIVDSGDIRQLGGEDHVHMPFWTADGGPLRRQCTREFKVRPVRRRVRELMGYHGSRGPHPVAGSVEQWIGFSLDEEQRRSPSGVQYIVNRFPLVELRMTRNDCIEFLHGEGLLVPVKSACIGCPYRRPSEWLEMRDQDVREFDDACEFDELIRYGPLVQRPESSVEADSVYVYRGRVPLGGADLVADSRRERRGSQLSMFV